MRTSTILLSAVTVLATLLAWAPAAYADGKFGKIEKTIEHGGQEREYILYKPENLPANAPLLLVLHGRGQTNQEFYELGFNDLADKNGFAVAYPQSTYAYFGGKDQNDPEAFKFFEWNAHNDPARADDVDFLSKLATSQKRRSVEECASCASLPPTPSNSAP